MDYIELINFFQFELTIYAFVYGLIVILIIVIMGIFWKLNKILSFNKFAHNL
jgi:hypothetical protein